MIGYSNAPVNGPFQNWTETLGLIDTGASVQTKGSGSALVGSTPSAALLTTGTVNKCYAGWIFPKHIGGAKPGSGRYHFISWNYPLIINFRFGFNTTLLANCYLMGAYGSSNTNVPSNYTDPNDPTTPLLAQNWLPPASCIWFVIDSTGAISVGTNAEGSTAVLYPTTGVVSVTGASEPILQELTFQTFGNGQVSVFLNRGRTPIATLSGLQTTLSATDNYPFIGIFNEPTGTAHAQAFLAFPLDVTLIN